MSEPEPTKEEAEEALRRIVRSGPLPSDDEILNSLRVNVAEGLMVESVGADGHPVFKMTPLGTTNAQRLIRDQLEEPPPRQDALLHVMEKAEQEQPDADREALMEVAGWVLFNEHQRLADRLASFDEAEDDETLKALIAALRAGAL